VVSRHLQGCSPRLCWLRTDGLATGPKPLSPTLGLSHGRKNEATQDDGCASLSLVVKLLPGVETYFDFVGACERLPTWTT
jgi:hypothetical protein